MVNILHGPGKINRIENIVKTYSPKKILLITGGRSYKKNKAKQVLEDKLSNYYLIGGRLVPYKRYDLAIRAFNRLNIPLKIFGVGPEMDRLKKIAKSNIDFLGDITESKKAELYSQCLGFIHPQEEDFGITAVEAMASGRPVIAYSAGGVRETVISGITGEFLQDQTWENLANTIIHFKPEKYNSEEIKNHAKKFSKTRFKQEIRDFINNISLPFQGAVRGG